ncbi:hypothetical protein [Parasitella parasitica]|uniref:C2H2-type domain-containing protein n=1 Tax=Parasitella parasitica TaxID=35722 RepID=A0A0B7N3G6_9FUNG|nr:hypothetical protein [Parasitella parasitica]
MHLAAPARGRPWYGFPEGQSHTTSKEYANIINYGCPCCNQFFGSLVNLGSHIVQHDSSADRRRESSIEQTAPPVVPCILGGKGFKKLDHDTILPILPSKRSYQDEGGSSRLECTSTTAPGLNQVLAISPYRKLICQRRYVELPQELCVLLNQDWEFHS